MTTHRLSPEEQEEHTGCNTMIMCDCCDVIIFYVPYSGTYELPEGTLEVGARHVCASCRYAGATVKFLQWGLNPNKVSVDIIGALNSTRRCMSNVRQIVGDLRIMVGLGHPRAKEIYLELTRIENLANMAESNENVAIAELESFGSG